MSAHPDHQDHEHDKHDERSPAAARHRFDDARSIRALAHPARVAIIDALATGDELTATQCAELTGLSPSATAYHLKFLEHYGFAEPAPPRPDRRERPWRATDRGTVVDLDSASPSADSAAAAVVGAYIDTTRGIAVNFAEGARAEPEHWRDAVLSNRDLWLTPAEFQRVAGELATVLEPYRRREQRPEDGRRVRVMTVVVPHPRRQPRSTR